MHKNKFSGKLHSVSLVESRSFSGPVRNRPPVNLTYSLSPDILSMILARIFNTLILVLLFYNCLDNFKQQQILHIHFFLQYFSCQIQSCNNIASLPSLQQRHSKEPYFQLRCFLWMKLYFRRNIL